MALTSICSWSRKAEGETSVSNCCMKYKVQRGQVHYGNSEEGEFISTRGNLGRLPEEGGLDQVFFGNSGTYTWEGREMCCQRSIHVWEHTASTQEVIAVIISWHYY